MEALYLWEQVVILLVFVKINERESIKNQVIRFMSSLKKEFNIKGDKNIAFFLNYEIY